MASLLHFVRIALAVVAVSYTFSVSAEQICFYQDGQCTRASPTMPCQNAVPNTGLCGPAVMGTYATFISNGAAGYRFSVYLDQLCAGPALIQVNAAQDTCAQVVGIPILGNIFLKVTIPPNTTSLVPPTQTAAPTATPTPEQPRLTSAAVPTTVIPPVNETSPAMQVAATQASGASPLHVSMGALACSMLMGIAAFF